jgi:hypothetical protein
MSNAIVNGPTPPGAGRLRDVGMHVADEHGAAFVENLQPFGVAGENSLRFVGRSDGVDADVDDDGTGFDELRRHECGPPDRGDEDIGGSRHGRQVASP